jgi:hypothetical protein
MGGLLRQWTMRHDSRSAPGGGHEAPGFGRSPMERGEMGVRWPWRRKVVMGSSLMELEARPPASDSRRSEWLPDTSRGTTKKVVGGSACCI